MRQGFKNVEKLDCERMFQIYFSIFGGIRTRLKVSKCNTK